MNPRQFILLTAATVLALCTAGLAAGSAIPQPNPRLGINLAGPADWNTELPFVDVFRLARKWVSQTKGQPWGKGPELTLDEHGWVKKLEPNCWAETPICTIRGGHYPPGQYTVLYDGKGKIEFFNAAKIIASEPGKISINADPNKGGFHLKITQTDPDDYIRNIRVIMPGFLETCQDNPWHPVFLARWKGMACLRFMDFMHTNNSTISTWADRPKLSDATFTTKGIPLELLIDLANRLNTDPWFCIPHLADDDYVRNFAQMVKNRLNPDLKIYIEYSNEVWNGQFKQHHYAGQKGQELGFAEKPWEAAWRYTAYRSVQIFNIFEEVFGSADRLIRVLPTQAANPYVSERILEFQDAYKHADALAVAPYISFNIHPQAPVNPTAEVQNWTLDQLLDYVETKSLPQSIGWIQRQKHTADKFGLKLIAYEAGQHLVGVAGGENNETVTALLHKANAHPRMGKIYEKYLTAWTDAGGDLLCHFSSVSRWSKWGSWGLLQHYDDDPAKSPKFTAVLNWAASLNQPVNLPKQ